MELKSSLAKLYAPFVARQIRKWSSNSAIIQEDLLKGLIKQASNTAFGQKHNFSKIRNYQDYKKAVPVVDYEGLRSYIDKIIDGETDVLWPGKPLYFAKTSGTTSGNKYIPLTKESLPYHIKSAFQALMNYVHHSGNAGFYEGKMIFLSGSPELEKPMGDIPVGRLSGIVHRHVPSWLQKNRMPSHKINCIEDWEEKVEAIVEETWNKDLRLISGIAPWVQMYFDKLLEKTGKPIKEVFHNFSLFVHGGVNFEPYRAKLEQSIGAKVPTLETYPASEGFIAFQDIVGEKEGLLLLLNHGIFYEFIPMGEFHNDNPTRLSIGEVDLDTNYAIVLNSNAGLWGYIIGDTVKFVSKNPYRIVVTGRTSHYISAFGEHVIAEEVEGAITEVDKEEGMEITEFTVAPQVKPTDGLPYHEWFVEFAKTPKDIASFAARVDKLLQQKNTYYKDLLDGKILQTLKITPLQSGAFVAYMKSQDKLGGQNKVPRLSNDRTIVDNLSKWKV